MVQTLFVWEASISMAWRVELFKRPLSVLALLVFAASLCPAVLSSSWTSPNVSSKYLIYGLTKSLRMEQNRKTRQPGKRQRASQEPKREDWVRGDVCFSPSVVASLLLVLRLFNLVKSLSTVLGISQPFHWTSLVWELNWKLLSYYETYLPIQEFVFRDRTKLFKWLWRKNTRTFIVEEKGKSFGI